MFTRLSWSNPDQLGRPGGTPPGRPSAVGLAGMAGWEHSWLMGPPGTSRLGDLRREGPARRPSERRGRPECKGFFTVTGRNSATGCCRRKFCRKALDLVDKTVLSVLAVSAVARYPPRPQS